MEELVLLVVPPEVGWGVTSVICAGGWWPRVSPEEEQSACE